MAVEEINKCWVHFMVDDNSQFELPNCNAFARLYRKLRVNNWDFGYSFFKVQLERIAPLYGLHVDANAGLGVGESAAEQRSWRVLGNFGDKARYTTYSLQAPKTAELLDIGGLRVATAIDESLLRQMCLGPRNKSLVECGVFCVSEVMHQAGENAPDTAISFGFEEPIRRGRWG